MKQLMPVLFACLLAACSSKDPFTKLEKLSGLWQTNNSETDLYEQWSKAKGNTMYGKSYTMNGTDSIVYERVEIRKEGEDVFYIPTVKDQNNNQPVSFKLVSSTDSSFTFENKQHDFPQRVIYRFVGKDSLVGRIEGNNKGEDQSQEFYYRRVKNYNPG
jgi:hypothetical protein